MKQKFTILLLILLTSFNCVQAITLHTGKDTIRVACIGNSITYGSQIKDRDRDSYPAVLGRILGEGYWVKNFGQGGRTLLNKGDRPYMNEQIFQDALAFNPHIVVIKLGTNDSKSFNWKHKEDFKTDLQTMVNAFNALPTRPKIYLCYPSKAYQTGDNINDDIIAKEIIPMIKEVAQKNTLPVIDLYTAMDGKPEMFPDKVHPNAEGAKVMAETVAAQIVHANVSAGFKLISPGESASVYYSGNEKVIHTALNMLIKDSELVTKTPLSKASEIKANTIVVGIPEKNPKLREWAERFRLNHQQLSGKWEAYTIQAVRDGVNSYLFVMGSDPRGTAYGLLELSRLMGVTPWVWWADVVPQRKAEVIIVPDGKVHAPSVQYRGIFLNDEDWALMPWSTRTFEPTPRRGAIGPKTYSKIFELLLRLRANTIWPAMHECTVPFFMVEGNKEAAEKYGIVLGTSHAEPMMRTNTGEWDSRKNGPFNFLTNQNSVLTYWEGRVKELAAAENIYTMGMRGIHDGRMQGVNSIDEETATLQRVIKEQRDMLTRNYQEKDINSIPQVFVPYKEVLKAYDNGLVLPEDITLVWCDDNHGYIMRLSDPEEQKRMGGAGVYYHISYWGKPHDYLWLASTQPGLIYAEMKRAWENGAQRLWVINVGDIKPGEYLTEFFMDMAWDINAFTGNSLYAHQKKWLEKTFGTNPVTDKVDYILRQYYHLAGQRKPEHMGFNKVESWSEHRNGLEPVQDPDALFTTLSNPELRIRAYNEIACLSTQIYEKEIPHHLKAAYFQLVHYPVVASGAMNRKMLYAWQSREYADKDTELAAYYARMATDAYQEIAALDYTYNKDMQHGKWDLMMDMKPRDLPVFQKPVLPELPFVNNYPVTAVSLPLAKEDNTVVMNASEFVNNIQLETIENLGYSGRVVCLPVAKKIHPKQPHIAYNVNVPDKGTVKVNVGVIPQHSVHGKTKRRYAIVVDKQKPQVVETQASFLSDKWAENVLRNQSVTSIAVDIDEAGEHTIRIYALDEELLVDIIFYLLDV